MSIRKYDNFKFSNSGSAIAITRTNTGSASGKQVIRVPNDVFWKYVTDEIREMKISSIEKMTAGELIREFVK